MLKTKSYRARLVVRGFLQKLEVFALVARIETIRNVVTIANSKGWIIHQHDVKSIVLNGPLNKEVYVL